MTAPTSDRTDLVGAEAERVVFRRVLCGLDSSPQGLEAVRQADVLQGDRGSLTVVSVLDVAVSANAGWAATMAAAGLKAEAQQALASAQTAVPGATYRLVEGRPDRVVLEEARRMDATLLVVGTHGFSRSVGIALGSVTTVALHDAPCSVLVARERPAGEAVPRSIVAGLDGSLESAAAWEVAGPWRIGLGVRIWPVAASKSKGFDRAAVELLADDALIEDGEPVDTLVGAADRVISWWSVAAASTESEPRQRQRAGGPSGFVLRACRQAARHAMTSRLLVAGVLVAIGVGGLLHLLSEPAAGNAVWAAATAVVLAPLTWSVGRALLHGDIGVDAIALVAMAASLALGEYLAGVVVGLMLAGGNALEESAAGRARRELKALVGRAPRVAHRRVGETVEEVPADELAIGDHVLVRHGEVVPVDGLVTTDEALLDESALTGEPLPVSHREGATVRSGTANVGDAFELRAIRPASESAYAAVVRLVQEAERHRAPFVRMADRYAALFLPVTLVAAGLAWAFSGDPVRALAVLVVATPCPLILAAPVAILSGVSRAARVGIIVKGGAAIEKLGEARTVVLDKTGTLTLGTPGIDRIVAFDGIDPDETLRLAASLDQLSAHSLAEALVEEARRRGLRLSFPDGVVEGAGEGAEGRVDDRRVTVGSESWLGRRGYPLEDAQLAELDEADGVGRAKVLVGVEGRLAGAVVMADHLRPDAADLVRDLRTAGIRHVALATGDREAVAREIAREVGVDRVYADQSPEEKLELVRSIQEDAALRPVVMVGDGVNDAPALALADVGIAMGTSGATVASEAADAVILVDRIGRVADAVRIGRRSLRIARQSVLVGIGLSMVAMAFAAFGFIPPVYGALLQEVIDVAVIVNALRALRD